MIARAQPVVAAVLAGIGLFACQDSISVGGSPSPAGTPEAAYRAAYDLYLGAHRMLINNLFKTHPPNFEGAQHAAERCAYELSRMQSLLAEPQRAQIGAVIAKYQNASRRLSRRSDIGTDAQVSDWEHVIRRDFVFHRVTLLEAGAPVSPQPQSSVSAAASPSSPSPIAPPPPTQPPAKAAPDWLYFSAWEQLQAELRAKWSSGENCGPTFDRLIDTLERYQAALGGNRAVKLGAYIDAYRAAHQATSGFRELPPGGTREDVLNDLKAIESALRLYCKPSDR